MNNEKCVVLILIAIILFLMDNLALYISLQIHLFIGWVLYKIFKNEWFQ